MHRKMRLCPHVFRPLEIKHTPHPAKEWDLQSDICLTCCLPPNVSLFSRNAITRDGHKCPYGRLHSAVPFLNLKTQGTNLHALQRHLPCQATSKHSLPDACLSGISSEPLLAFPRDSLYRTSCTPRRRCTIAQLTCPKAI